MSNDKTPKRSSRKRILDAEKERTPQQSNIAIDGETQTPQRLRPPLYSRHRSDGAEEEAPPQQSNFSINQETQTQNRLRPPFPALFSPPKNTPTSRRHRRQKSYPPSRGTGVAPLYHQLPHAQQGLDDTTPLLPPSRLYPFMLYHANSDRSVNVNNDTDDDSSVSSHRTNVFHHSIFRDLKSTFLPSSTEIVTTVLSPNRSARVFYPKRNLDREDVGLVADNDYTHGDASVSSSHSSTKSAKNEKYNSPSPFSRESQSLLSDQEYAALQKKLVDQECREQVRLENEQHVRVKRSLRRRLFLLLTEPQSSIFSAAFFILLIVLIFLSNIVMMMQTMDYWNFTPEECDFCGGNGYGTMWDDNMGATPIEDDSMPCTCPPSPTGGIVLLEDYLIYMFTAEWIMRVLCYAPPAGEEKTGWRFYVQWLSYLTEASTILDALAIFPYYIERYDKTNGLLTLRLCRLFRVFQLLRLGQYNVTFVSLTNVLVESILSLNILLIVLIFGAAFFGSMIYWLEKGTWKYTDYTDPPSFRFMRMSADGINEEPSPFISIPSAFWWFIVTSTTVGYGDVYPTSVSGKVVASLAMLTGVLVIAFPVSVFSDLWSKELKKAGALAMLDDDSHEGLDEFVEESERMRFEDSEKNGAHELDATPLTKNTSSLPQQRRLSQPSSRLPSSVIETEVESDLNTVNRDGIGDSNNSSSDRPTNGNTVMSASDMDAIHRHLSTIDNSQQQIRQILKRYDRPGGYDAPYRNDSTSTNLNFS